jgi:hypothetical protein
VLDPAGCASPLQEGVPSGNEAVGNKKTNVSDSECEILSNDHMIY